LSAKVGKKPFLAVSAQRAVYAVFGLLTLAAGLLVYLLLTGNYTIAYVAAHTDPGMPALYKFTAWWGGQEGSLLSLVVAAFGDTRPS
jgi:cytochrome c-type biogenesis protein CcmF